MKVVAVDIQGFVLDKEFHPKELTIHDGNQTNHYLFKPPTSFNSLSDSDKKQVRFTERSIHGIHYSSGYIEYSAVSDIIKDNLLSANIIYVRGHQKIDYLRKKLFEVIGFSGAAVYPYVVNVETFDHFAYPPPKFQADIPHNCTHHMKPTGLYRCSKRNCEDLFRWVYGFLPQ